MPILRCQVGTKLGWKFGGSGTCFVGPGGRKKAVIQGRAISAKTARTDEIADAVSHITFRQTQGLKRPRKNPPKRLPVWLYPYPVEREYERTLLEYVNTLIAITNKQIVPHLQSLQFSRNQEVPEASRADDYVDDANRLVSSVNLSYDAVPMDFSNTATAVGSATNVWNDKEWQKQLRAAFGVDVFQREPFMTSTLKSFTAENVSLITKMSADYKANIGESVQRGLRQGDSITTLTKQIEKQGEMTKNRARLIARDQVGKLNGQFTELRQTNLGIRTYIWRDARDARVRSSHRHHNGRKFSWDEPPPVTGHPGQDFQCRCYAEPNFQEVWDELQGSPGGGSSSEVENAAIIPGTLPGTVGKSFKTKASAQSQKSRGGFVNTNPVLNPETGRWELVTKDLPKPVPSPVVPPKPVIPKPVIPKPDIPEPAGEIKVYKTKASAQSAKSRGKFKDATIVENKVTGKWELHIGDTGTKPTVKAKPKFKPEQGQKPIATFAKESEAKDFADELGLKDVIITKRKGGDWDVYVAKETKKKKPPVISTKGKVTAKKWEFPEVPDEGMEFTFFQRAGSRAHGEEIIVRKNLKGARVILDKKSKTYIIQVQVKKKGLISKKASDDFKSIIDKDGRPAFRNKYGWVRSEGDIRRDVRKTGLLPKEVERELHKYEKTIVYNNYESGALSKLSDIDITNKSTQRKKGQVHISGNFNNKVLTHNHPGNGWTFSSADVYVGATNTQTQIRAVAKDFLYTLSPSKKTWISQPDLVKYYNGSLDKFRKAYDADIKKAFGNASNRIFVEMEKTGMKWNDSGYNALKQKASEIELRKVTQKYADRHKWHFNVTEYKD